MICRFEAGLRECGVILCVWFEAGLKEWGLLVIVSAVREPWDVVGIHIHIHTHALTRTHTHTHTYTRTHTEFAIHSCIHAHIHTHNLAVAIHVTCVVLQYLERGRFFRERKLYPRG